MERRSSVAADQETKVAQLTRERDEALEQLSEAFEQQTATSEVLKVISSSPDDLQPVFEAMLANATWLCEAKFGVLYRSEGDGFRAVALYGAPLAYVEERRRNPIIRPTPETALGRAVATKQTVQIADALEEPNYFDAPSGYTGAQLAKLAGARTILAVPMIKEKELVGVISIYRQEVRPFTDKQIALLTNFATQAVIAIENTRLLNELRQSLEQQTATADVLRVISSSPGELEPVFQTILQNGAQLCEAKFGNLYLCQDGALHTVASYNVPTAFAEARRRGPWHPKPNAPAAEVIRTKRTVHVIDLADTPVYRERIPETVDAVELGGVRTTVLVPMLRENELVGIVAIFRQDVRPYTDKQIDLLQNFAAQAVIAIENARLLNELHQRTDDLGKALQQQTATAEVLKVIARTQGELQPVFETMLAKATELCGASYGALWLRVDDGFRYAALHGDLPQIWTDHLRNGTVIRVRPDVPLARLMQTLRPVPIPDMRTDPSYLNGDPLPVSGVDIGGIRTLVLVPMIKNSDLVGAIAIYRKEVHPFAEKQIELLSNFAAQAVIAIENTRLLNELRQRTDDLTEFTRAADRHVEGARGHQPFGVRSSGGV